MRIAIFSDIHCNVLALNAVQKHARQKQPPVDLYWFLGDLIGYGPQPLECIRLLKKNADHSRWISGNHERLWLQFRAHGIQPESDLSRISIQAEKIAREKWVGARVEAVEALLLNMREMGDDPDVNWYANECSVVEHHPYQVKELDGLRLVFSHGASLPDPHAGYIYPWSMPYMLQVNVLEPLLPISMPTLVLFGHTHIQTLLHVAPDASVTEMDFEYGKPQPLGPYLTVINPGSVGSAGDLDTRAAYAIIDTNHGGTVTFFRVVYPYQKVGTMMAQKRYPLSLITQLEEAPIRTNSSTPREYVSRLERRKSAPGG